MRSFFALGLFLSVSAIGCTPTTGELDATLCTAMPMLSWSGGPASSVLVVEGDRDETPVWRASCGALGCLNPPLTLGEPQTADEEVALPAELAPGSYTFTISATNDDGSSWADSSRFELAEPVVVEDAQAATPIEDLQSCWFPL